MSNKIIIYAESKKFKKNTVVQTLLAYGKTVSGGKFLKFSCIFSLKSVKICIKIYINFFYNLENRFTAALCLLPHVFDKVNKISPNNSKGQAPWTPTREESSICFINFVEVNQNFIIFQNFPNLLIPIT